MKAHKKGLNEETILYDENGEIIEFEGDIVEQVDEYNEDVV